MLLTQMLSFSFYVVFLYALFLECADSFATPKSEFLLDIDGNSVDVSLSHLCVLEQKQGTPIGGRVRCFGDDYDEIGHVQNTPNDVSSHTLQNAMLLRYSILS